MSSQPSPPSEVQPPLTATRLALGVVEVFAWPALTLWLGGDWRWGYGWAFAAWLVALCCGCIAWLYRHDPALLAERFRANGTGAQQGWDRFVLGFLMWVIVAWFVLIPLDASRYHWTPNWPLWARLLGALAMAASSWFLFRSFTDNTFLSPLVRIQNEREHRVVSTGVYGLVRHPMYLGAALFMCGVPLWLGSRVGIGLGVLSVLVLVVRIFGEERLLVQQLAGYESYREQVRYRLIPLVW
jgi:protein-S-isoprenylcysteine O-methyltransferase Ste14